MGSLDEIKQAVRGLSRWEREQLAEWMLNLTDFDPGIAEAAADYRWGVDGSMLSVEEYLRTEGESPRRHEYIGGLVFAMSGASLRHKVIIDSLLLHLAPSLRGGPCRALSDGVKLHIRAERGEIFYYPDLMVVCGAHDMSRHFVDDARVVIEVLSPSTELTDRREKTLNYRCVPSLEEFALVAQASHEITLFRRSANWSPEVLRGPETILELQSLGTSLTLQQIYADAGL